MKKIILLVLALILTACTSSATTEFDKNLAKWQAAKITHYRYSLSVGCFCAFMDQMPVNIEMKDGEIVSVTSTNGNAITATDDLYEILQSYAGMDMLFNQVKAASENADKVEVTYNPTNGFPTSITIDLIEEAVDDELYITVGDFKVLE